jgi:4-hydroxythreonine-4-phosphate dehydrogenase
MPLRLGISIGDPNGIGPEISLKAIQTLQGEVDLIPIGDPHLLQTEAERLHLTVPREIFSTATPYPNAHYGNVSAEAGAVSAEWVDRGIEACLKGELDGLITAPICKESWKLAGIHFPGHTELLGQRCNTRRFGMLLAGKGLRVMLATRHVPVSRIPETLNEHEIRLAVDLLCEGLPLLGVASPRIAICGLNPHAGDGGTIGTDEVDWIAPLIHTLQQEAKPVTGPHPGDTVFHAAVNGAYDAIVAMYHDQGLAPLKLWAFDEGVNITLGLPMVRTSPDHGTAFDIAGQGIARPASMIEAIRTAQQLASQPLPWKQ